MKAVEIFNKYKGFQPEILIFEISRLCTLYKTKQQQQNLTGSVYWRSFPSKVNANAIGFKNNIFFFFFIVYT